MRVKGNQVFHCVWKLDFMWDHDVELYAVLHKLWTLKHDAAYWKLMHSCKPMLLFRMNYFEKSSYELTCLIQKPCGKKWEKNNAKVNDSGWNSQVSFEACGSPKQHRALWKVLHDDHIEKCKEIAWKKTFSL